MKNQPTYKPGNELSAGVQKKCLAIFAHRYTKDHVPEWAKNSKYEVQFDSDKEWLKNTLFAIKKDGTLDRRVHYCHSKPTWPTPTKRKAL